MSTLREAAEPDWLDDEPFYNAMQRYRCAPREDQREVVACFEAVKRLVRSELAKPDARPAPAEPQPSQDGEAYCGLSFAQAKAKILALPLDDAHGLAISLLIQKRMLLKAPAPQPAGGERERYEFVLAQCREAQDIAASRGGALGPNDRIQPGAVAPRLE